MQTGFRLLSHLRWNDIDLRAGIYRWPVLWIFLNSAKLNTSNGSSVTCVYRVKKWPKKVEKFFEKSLVVKKKGVPLQSLSETGVRQEPAGRSEPVKRKDFFSSLKRLRRRPPTRVGGCTRSKYQEQNKRERQFL